MEGRYFKIGKELLLIFKSVLFTWVNVNESLISILRVFYLYQLQEVLLRLALTR